MSKYIIEIEEGKEGVMFCQSGIVSIGLHLEDEESLRGLGIKSAIPYTEPDMEKVREEAYRQGYDTGYGTKVNEFYEQGLVDAWEAARKIALMDTETSENVTGYFGLFRIMENLTPMQAIEKIRQYEQKQEEIQVWDEVINGRNFKGTVTDIKDDGMLTIFCQDGTWINSHTRFWKKTGRHFPEIAEVLQKMKE